tara:strand:+ start:213 stop:929 length:717 start_codon:yes stop_codon:yes gene_type:complete
MLRYVLILTFLTTSAFAQAPAEGPANAEKPAKAAGETTQVKVEQKTKSAPVSANSGDDAYRLKITDLQGRVDELKEKIFRTKTRLAILKESILSTTIAGAEARLIHRNEMGASFNLEKVIYSLDGTPIFSKVDADGDLGDQKELQIFDGPIVPGNHTVSVVMVYRGNGFGIFSYLRGYVFTLRSSHTFHAEEGKRIQVKVVGYEKGGISTDLKDRPDIRFENVLSNPGRGTRDPSVNK